MLVALPKQRTGLSAAEGKLTAALVGTWVAALEREQVWVTLPRFEVKPPHSLALERALQSLGTVLAFDGQRADFTGMFKHQKPADRLSISNVFHEAVVAVDEKGTEAAAATAVVMGRGAGAPSEPVRFNADHPFLFFIRDVKTSTILFVGRVVDPS